MAKVKGPLFSLSASGALASSLVYFGWKGLKCVRSYVIPTNPKTALQIAQRAYLKEVVPLLHTQMLDQGDPFTADDISAYIWLASLAARPRTWFNALCKTWIDAGVAGAKKVFYAGILATAASGKVTITAQMVKLALDTFPTVANIRWGTSKSLLMYSKQQAVVTDGAVTLEITVAGDGLVAGTNYYFQIRAVETGEETPAVSGLVTAIPLT